MQHVGCSGFEYTNSSKMKSVSNRVFILLTSDDNDVVLYTSFWHPLYAKMTTGKEWKAAFSSDSNGSFVLNFVVGWLS